MNRFTLLAAAILIPAGAAQAQPMPQPMSPPMPPMAGPTSAAQPYLFKAGQSDVFEISTSQMAVLKSQNPDVRAFASMLIQHHTMTTNLALAAARVAGVTPPPPVLDPRQQAMITQLQTAAPADFDRVYLLQQVPAHEEALALHRFYAERGDTAQLRTTAQGAVPIVIQHLERAQALMAGR